MAGVLLLVRAYLALGVAADLGPGGDERGRPVLATAVGGTPVAVIDGVTGRLVPGPDDEVIGRALHELLTHPEDLERTGKGDANASTGLHGRSHGRGDGDGLRDGGSGSAEAAARRRGRGPRAGGTAGGNSASVSMSARSAQLKPERWAATLVKSVMTRSRSLRWERYRAWSAGVPGSASSPNTASATTPTSSPSVRASSAADGDAGRGGVRRRGPGHGLGASRRGAPSRRRSCGSSSTVTLTLAGHAWPVLREQ